ncbi:NAD(P)-binding protein [Auricularia subglabra TFB-10046 SS5]|nr:NAD(P)-binding protein [Auricularia subglabra TFB-10046 SS5]
MPSLANVLTSNALFAPARRPVLVVFGGTSGVGLGTVKAFARHTKGRIHIVILGRSRQAADSLIASLPRHSESLYEFVQTDALLISDARATCRALLVRLPHINYLVLSHGAALYRQPVTAEGPDPLLALMLYGRVRIALDLTPLLEKAATAGEDARVMTVARAGTGGPVDLDDVDLKRALSGPFWKAPELRARLATYTDIYTLELAQRHPALSYTHVYPGFVASGLKRSMPLLMWGILSVLEPIFARSPEDCGEFMAHALIDLRAKTGAHFKGDTAEDIEPSVYASQEARDVVWKHLVETTDL